jgi:hypothetical protein
MLETFQRFRVQYPEDGSNKYSKTLATLSTSTQWKERPKAKSASTCGS